jgi:hypothetical protein
MNLNRGFLPAFLLACTLAADAHADPVQITRGFLATNLLSGFAEFEFEAADAGFFAASEAEPGVVGPTFCFPCAPGDSINMSTNYNGTIGIGTATVGGTTYENLTFAGVLLFASGPATTPSTPGNLAVTQPFTFTGDLLGILDYNTSDERLAFDQALSGHGTVIASFSGMIDVSGTPLFSFESVRYDFASDAAVPEPATLLLVSGGLGAALVRKRLGRRAPGAIHHPSFG